MAILTLTLLGLLAGAPVEIETANDSGAEHRTSEQLRVLLERYDVSPWVYTTRVRIEEGVIPHSHPVLTLGTGTGGGVPLLAEFLHEQLHWFLEERPEAVDAAVAELQEAFPEVPVGHPEGARSERSTYEHLVVTHLEHKVLGRLVGAAEARDTMESWSHYRWIYRTMLSHETQFDELVARYDLEPW
jgi:hypothetical protein